MIYKFFYNVSNFYRRRLWSNERYARYLGVKIGEDCHIATTYFGSEPYLIEIGNHVQITNDVKFFTHSGGWVFRQEIPNMDSFGKIRIGDNVYIGNNVLILPGVTVGSNVMVGAGSVITRSIPDNSIVAGNPAKIINTVEVLKAKMMNLNVGTKGMDKIKKKDYLLSLPEDKFIKK